MPSTVALGPDRIQTDVFSLRQVLAVPFAAASAVDWRAVESWLVHTAAREDSGVVAHEDDVVDALAWHPAITATVWSAFLSSRRWSISRGMVAAVRRALSDRAPLDALARLPLETLSPDELVLLLRSGMMTANVISAMARHQTLHAEVAHLLIRSPPTDVLPTAQVEEWATHACALVADELRCLGDASAEAIDVWRLPILAQLVVFARSNLPGAHQKLLQTVVAHLPRHLDVIDVWQGVLPRDDGAVTRRPWIAAATVAVLAERVLSQCVDSTQQNQLQRRHRPARDVLRHLLRELDGAATRFAVLAGLLRLSPHHAEFSSVHRFVLEISSSAATSNADGAPGSRLVECTECGNSNGASCGCPIPSCSREQMSAIEQLRCCSVLNSDSSPAAAEAISLIGCGLSDQNPCQRCGVQLVDGCTTCVSCGIRQQDLIDRLLAALYPPMVDAHDKALMVVDGHCSDDSDRCGAPRCGAWLWGSVVCGKCGSFQDPADTNSRWTRLLHSAVCAISRTAWDHQPMIRFVAMLRMGIEGKLPSLQQQQGGDASSKKRTHSELQQAFAWLHTEPYVAWVRHLIHRVVELAKDASLSVLGEGGRRHTVITYNALVSATLDLIELMNVTTQGDMIGFDTLLMLRRLLHETEGDRVRDLRIIYLVQMRLTRSDIVGPDRCPQCIGHFGASHRCGRCSTARVLPLTERLQARGLQVQIAAVQPRPANKWMVQLD